MKTVWYRKIGQYITFLSWKISVEVLLRRINPALLHKLHVCLSIRGFSLDSPHSGICLLFICNNPGYVCQGRNHRPVDWTKRRQTW